MCGKSGYPYDFILYQGANTELNKTELSNFGHGAAAVLHLSNRITDPGHCLYFDNYFSSLNLMEILSQKQIYAAGTARINRFNNPNFSSDKLMQRMGRGSSEESFSTDGKIVILK